jgi:hypothetical protein
LPAHCRDLCRSLVTLKFFLKFVNMFAEQEKLCSRCFLNTSQTERKTNLNLDLVSIHKSTSSAAVVNAEDDHFLSQSSSPSRSCCCSSKKDISVEPIRNLVNIRTEIDCATAVFTVAKISVCASTKIYNAFIVVIIIITANFAVWVQSSEIICKSVLGHSLSLTLCK